MKTRKRNVDIQKLDNETLDNLSIQIGEKVKDIIDNAIVEANKILNIYGMEAKMEVVIKEKEKVTLEK